MWRFSIIIFSSLATIWIWSPRKHLTLSKGNAQVPSLLKRRISEGLQDPFPEGFKASLEISIHSKLGWWGRKRNPTNWGSSCTAEGEAAGVSDRPGSLFGKETAADNEKHWEKWAVFRETTGAFWKQRGLTLQEKAGGTFPLGQPAGERGLHVRNSTEMSDVWWFSLSRWSPTADRHLPFVRHWAPYSLRLLIFHPGAKVKLWFY